MSDTATNTTVEQMLPAVKSWPLAPTTPKMAREIKAILARVHAETDAVIASDAGPRQSYRKSPRAPLGMVKKSLKKKSKSRV